jgi:hypothetical protein
MHTARRSITHAHISTILRMLIHNVIQMLAAWKISYDKVAKGNVWKNYITGESTTAQPQGWRVNPDDRWVVQVMLTLTFFQQKMPLLCVGRWRRIDSLGETERCS